MIIKKIAINDWQTQFPHEMQKEAVDAIEQGKILLFPHLPFILTPHETKFLSPDFADIKAKNISFNPHNNQLRCAKCSATDYENLKDMLTRFSRYAEKLVHDLLPPYAKTIKLGRTSYRPVEISGRPTSYRKDDTRLHVDAFPATPNHGRRILRVFTNINPEGKDRVWRVGESFVDVAKRFLPYVTKPFYGKAALLKMLGLTKSYRTEYDHIMLQIHDRMKANLDYQKTVPQSELRFSPGNTWIVQTDHVSHAAMSGQYVLEQTFYLPVDSMANPQLSPLRTLEKMMGRVLI